MVIKIKLEHLIRARNITIIVLIASLFWLFLGMIDNTLNDVITIMLTSMILFSIIVIYFLIFLIKEIWR